MLRSFILETASSPGTGTFQLLGAPTGRTAFISAASFASASTVFYAADNGSAWEEGYGIVTSGSPPTLTRNVLKNSAGNTSPINFTGTVDIYCTLPAERVGYVNNSGNLVVGPAQEKFHKSTMAVLNSAQTIADSTETAISWSAAADDGLGAWSSGNPTRLTVPASGVSRVVIKAGIVFQSNNTGYRRLRILKNGASFDGYPYASSPGVATAQLGMTVCSAPLAVNGTDYFECMVTQTSGGNLNLPGPVLSWFSMERAA